MKQLSILIFLACTVFVLTISAPSGGEEASKSNTKPAATLETSPETDRVYPIAPGVWYPTDGPIPEKPIRYYRVRCWPGCHSGSDYGQYPERGLSMKPIHRTSALRDQSGTYQPSGPTAN